MRVLTVVGARPQFVKAAAISREVIRRRHAGHEFTEILVHTGQHYDERMSDVFFAELGLPEPHEYLGVGSARHAEQTGEMMKRLDPVMVRAEPDVVLVYGDTNSTMAAALVASKLHLPVAHVEAGLRSFNRFMPEEINRIVTDHVSALLLCPSEVAKVNLAAEGVVEGVHVVGDVMYDVLCDALERLPPGNPVGERLGVESGQYILATVHRPANTDDPLRFAELVSALVAVAAERDVIWPVHPRIAAQVNSLRLPERLRITEPASYGEMLSLERDALAITTDSGGVQKEAYWLGVPCLTLREETEWIETVDNGWNQLLGARMADLADAVAAVASDPSVRAKSRPPVYGMANAARIVVDLLSGDL